MSVMKLSTVLGLNAESLRKQKLQQSKKLRQMIEILRKELNTVKPKNQAELLKELKRIEGEITFTFAKESLAKLGEQIIQVAKQISGTINVEIQLTSDIEKQKQLQQRKLQASQDVDKYIKLFSSMIPADETTVKALKKVKEEIDKADTEEKVIIQEQALKVALTISKRDSQKQVEELTGMFKELMEQVGETEKNYPWRKTDAESCHQVITKGIQTLEDTSLSEQDRQLGYVNAKVEMVKLSQLLYPRKMPTDASDLADPKAALSTAGQDLGGLIAAIEQEASPAQTKDEIPTITTTIEPVVKELKTILDSVVNTIGEIETGYTTISPITEAQVELKCSELRNHLAQLKRLAGGPLVANWSKCPFKVTQGSVDQIPSQCDALIKAIK